MYDTEIYTQDSGNTLTLIYLHGRVADEAGGSRDETVVLASHQSADGQIFHNHIIDGKCFEGRLEALLKTYKDRGYKLPGSDTQTASLTTIEEEYEVSFEPESEDDEDSYPVLPEFEDGPEDPNK